MALGMREMMDRVNEAYRRGYQDGVADRANNPVVVAPVHTPAPEPMNDVLEKALARLNLEASNLLSYDGSPQMDVDEAMRRTGLG